MTQTQKTARLAALEALPTEMQDHALVDWATVALLMGIKDAQYARRVLKREGIPLVQVTDRRHLPRWGTLREHLRAREAQGTLPKRRGRVSKTEHRATT